MKFKLNIAGSRSALFDDGDSNQIARLLRQVADDVEGGSMSGALYDMEGFCCGDYKLEEGIYCCEDCGTESDAESEGTTCRECGRGIISENE
jgi:hypothetical protein